VHEEQLSKMVGKAVCVIKACLSRLCIDPRTWVQRRQLPSQARGMSKLDPGTRAGLEEALNALVPEASNHSKIVARGATRSKWSSSPLGS
jgi:hypothetical protein